MPYAAKTPSYLQEISRLSLPLKSIDICLRTTAYNFPLPKKDYASFSRMLFLYSHLLLESLARMHLTPAFSSLACLPWRQETQNKSHLFEKESLKVKRATAFPLERHRTFKNS